MLVTDDIEIEDTKQAKQIYLYRITATHGLPPSAMVPRNLPSLRDLPYLLPAVLKRIKPPRAIEYPKT